jgi:aryl-alcohol dehydrogenase-like predicted oxidoreductase
VETERPALSTKLQPLLCNPKLQPEYNLHAREQYECELAYVAQRYEIGVIPHFSARSSWSRCSPRWL